MSNWKAGYRDFNSVTEMNETIIQTVNQYVKWDDTLWFLGDLCFGDHRLTPRWRERINCRTIHWIKGNHDKHADEYPAAFESIQDYWQGKLDNHEFVLCHYAFRVWRGSHKGFYHCYGHSHASLEHSPNGKSMDVGIDNAYKMFGEYRPFSLDEVVSILNKREVAFHDHHSPKAKRQQ